MFKKHGGKIIIGVAVLLLVGSFWWSNEAGKKADVGVEVPEVHVLGNPDAAVVLTEYSDLECPACASFHPVVKDLMEAGGENIRFEYKHYPLVSRHPFAVPAAKAAEAAGQQGKFFEMHDLIFENQQSWAAAAAPQVFFNQYAEELELDMDLFKRHMRSTLIDEKIQREFEEARAKGYTGTPTFELNGQLMTFDTFDDFLAQIETAIYGTDAGETGTSTEADAAAEAGSEVRFGL